MHGLSRDIRDAWRGMLRQRAFTAAALLMLSLGIGAACAIFAAVQAVVFELPFADPDRVVTIRPRSESARPLPISVEQFKSWQTATDVFDAVAAYTLVSPVMTGSDAALRLQAEAMTSSMFDVLGVQPSLGRAFRDDDGRVVVLSDAFWRSRFAADAGVLGRAILLDDGPATIVGVMPAGFDGPRSRPGDAWVPFSMAVSPNPVRPPSVSVLARLARGVSPAAARSRLEGMPLDSAGGSRWSAGVETAREDFLYQDALTSVRMLVGGVVLLLLMAWINVASLLLGRNISRRRELAVRMAVGASGWQIIRQAAVESLLVSLAAAMLGLLIARWTVAAMVPLIPRWFPRIAQIDVDWGVAAFATIASGVTALVVSIWPAWSASRQDFGALVKTGERGNSGGARRSRTALVIVEATLGMILLTMAAMLVGSFVRLNPTHPGFEFRDRVRFSVRFAGARYSDDFERVAAVDALISRLRAIPGVVDVTSVTHVPLYGTSSTYPVRVNGADVAERTPTVHFRAALPNYLASMGMPILKGRGLTSADTPRSQPVAVVNETLAARVLRGREPLDAELVIDEPDGRVVRRIVGVVRDVRESGADLRSWPEVFVPYAQSPLTMAAFVVRTAPGVQAEPEIRRAVGELDAALPVDRLETMEQVVAKSVATQRFFAMLMGAFAVAAVVLAFTGLYSVAAWSVSQRTREIGVRLAVGATPRDIGRLVLRYGASVGVTGAVAGALCATASSRLIESYLYGFSARQPALIAALGIGLSLIIALASYIPARRAMRVDPMVALRSE